MPSDSNLYLTFLLKEEEYGIPIKNVKEILEMTEITQIPKAYHFISGVINLRGKILPIMDLKLRIGLPFYETTDRSGIILLDHVNESQENIGILVDEVLDVREIADIDFNITSKVRNETVRNILTGIGKCDEDIVLLVDVNKAISIHSL